MTKRIVSSCISLFIISALLGSAFDNAMDGIKWLFFKDGIINEIKSTIVKYNKIFTDLYVSDGGISMLDEFPSSVKLKHEIYRNLDFLRARKLILIYDMADSRFVDINVLNPYYAEAVVYEEWNYLYQERMSRNIVSSIRGFGHGFRYYLRKVKGRWLVIDTEPVDMEPPEKHGLYY